MLIEKQWVVLML